MGTASTSNPWTLQLKSPVISPWPTTDSGLSSPCHAVTKGSAGLWAAVWRCVSETSGPRCRGIDQFVALESLKSFILKSTLTGDDMMEMGPLNWLCPLSLLSLSRLHSHSAQPLSSPSSLCPITLCLQLPPPPSFFFPFPPSLLLSSSLRCVERKMSDYFPADTALCDRGLELYITGWHFLCLPPLSLQTTSNIAGPFWSLKRLVLGEEPVLTQKQTKCFICHVCQSAICAA